MTWIGKLDGGQLDVMWNFLRFHGNRPCAFDEYGELVDLSGTGLDSEYDAEILMDKHGQLKFI